MMMMISSPSSLSRQIINVRKYSKLVRDHIKGVLYDQNDGYFMQDVIYSPTKEERSYVNFNELGGPAEYRLMLKEMYERRGVAWMTPCEIFAPWYSYAIAEYILCERRGGDKNLPLNLVEFGGGNGTNMMHILDYIKLREPNLYNRTNAIMIDISPAMSDRQREMIEPKHSNRCRYVRTDMTDHDMDPMDDECFVMGLEVLDNLPHDKIMWCDESNEWLETHVVAQGDDDDDDDYELLREIYLPLQDSLIAETLKLFPPPSNEIIQNEIKQRQGGMLSRLWNRFTSSAVTSSVFLPTGAVRLIHSLKRTFPSHRLILADFDHLPSPDVRLLGGSKRSLRDGSLNAYNAPLVASVDEKGKDLDYETYLLTRKIGTADIFFATDFDALSEAYFHIMGRPSRVFRSSEFLVDHADVERTRVAGGYNPLLEDFSNTRFLLS